MTADIHTLNIKDAKPREHVTLGVDRLGGLLALAEDLAYRRALLDAGIDPKEALRLRMNHEATFGTRADLYASLWRRGGKGL